MKYYTEPKSSCPIYGSCKQVETGACKETCWKKIQMSFQLDRSNIPRDYRCDVPLTKDKKSKDFKTYKELSEWVRDPTILHWRIFNQGEGLYLFSKEKGNGKTSWACKIAFNYLRGLRRTIDTLEEGKVLFVAVPELFDELKASFDNPAKAAEMVRFEERIKTSDLVIFDDIGAETPSKWVKEKLYIYINHREANGLSTIFTSNCTIDELEERLDDRIADRIYGLCRRKYGENWRDNPIYNVFEFKDAIGR